MPLETHPWDSTRHLDSDEAIAAYLEAAFGTEDPAFILHAFGIAARAKGMTQIAKDAGLSRESLYRALDETGNPEFATVLGGGGGGVEGRGILSCRLIRHRQSLAAVLAE